jgi:hypothetical protein
MVTQMTMSSPVAPKNLMTMVTMKNRVYRIDEIVTRLPNF